MARSAERDKKFDITDCIVNLKQPLLDEGGALFSHNKKHRKSGYKPVIGVFLCFLKVKTYTLGYKNVKNYMRLVYKSQNIYVRM